MSPLRLCSGQSEAPGRGGGAVKAGSKHGTAVPAVLFGPATPTVGRATRQGSLLTIVEKCLRSFFFLKSLSTNNKTYVIC